MNKIVLMILVAVTLHNSLYSQEDSARRASDKALLFSFQGFNLGGGAGGKFWLNRNYVFRVTGVLSYSDQDYNRELLSNLQSNPEYRRYNLSLGVGLEYHFLPDHALSPYVGVVANGGWTEYDYTYRYPDSSFKTVDIGRFIGGTLLLGVEYRLTSSISLAGEQMIGFSYSKYTGGNPYSSLIFQTQTSTVMLLIYL